MIFAILGFVMVAAGVLFYYIDKQNDPNRRRGKNEWLPDVDHTKAATMKNHDSAGVQR